MGLLFLTAFTTLLYLVYSESYQRKLQLNYEPDSNNEGSWPVARAEFGRFGDGPEILQCLMREIFLFTKNFYVRELDKGRSYSFVEPMLKSVFRGIMDDLMRRCSPLAEQKLFIPVSYPGTKWCGPGNTASNYSDLGPREADKCCRDHDHCDHIKSWNSKYGLINYGLRKLLNCQCEEVFDNCLKEIESRTEETDKKAALVIRYIYFDGIPRKCYRLYCQDEKFGENDTCDKWYGVWKKSYQQL